MNEHQYALLVITLSGLGQNPQALNTLDREQLETLVFLLAEARNTVEAWRVRWSEQESREP